MARGARDFEEIHKELLKEHRRVVAQLEERLGRVLQHGRLSTTPLSVSITCAGNDGTKVEDTDSDTSLGSPGASPAPTDDARGVGRGAGAKRRVLNRCWTTPATPATTPSTAAPPGAPTPAAPSTSHGKSRVSFFGAQDNGSGDDGTIAAGKLSIPATTPSLSSPCLSTASGFEPPSSSSEEDAVEELASKKKERASGNNTLCASRLTADSRRQSNSSRRSTALKAGLKPWPVWESAASSVPKPSERKLSLTSRNRLSAFEHMRLHARSRDFEERDEETTWLSFFDFLVVHPNGPVRLVFTLLGILIILFDIIFVPLDLFGISDAPFLTWTPWASISFWTVDVVMSFAVGFHRGEVLEMRFRKTIMRYLVTWFAMDFALVLMGWLELFLQNRGVYDELARGSRSLRALRTIRSVRLIRLLKLPLFFKSIILVVGRSQKISLCSGLAMHFSGLIIVSHVISCLWYSIGSSDKKGWVSVYFDQDVTWQHIYITSLHWSLTQFTPATMRVHPQTSSEVVFAVGVLLFGLLAFSSFISSMTNILTHLRNMKQEQDKKFLMLERYLHDKQISFYLSLRVRRYLDHYLEQHRHTPAEEDVEMLTYLSEPLQLELHYEVDGPVLKRHPFFVSYTTLNVQAMQRLCHYATKTWSLSCADVLFSCGDTAYSMYFVVSGELDYTVQETEDEDQDHVVSIDSKDWVAEIALWAQWEHCGQMRATTESVALALDSQGFREVVASSKLGKHEAGKYAVAAVRAITESSSPDLSDLEEECPVLPAELVREAFENKLRHSERSNGNWLRSKTMELATGLRSRRVTQMLVARSAPSF